MDEKFSTLQLNIRTLEYELTEVAPTHTEEQSKVYTKLHYELKQQNRK